MDERVLEWMANSRTERLDSLARGLMDFGTSPVAFGAIALITVGLVVVSRRFLFAITVGTALLEASIASAALKVIFKRPRPTATFALVNLPGYAMPSTHAARTAAIAAAIIGATTWLKPATRRVVAGLLVALVVVVGLAMVYLGGHWLTDVLVGWFIGGVIGTVSAAVVPRVLTTFDR